MSVTQSQHSIIYKNAQFHVSPANAAAVFPMPGERCARLSQGQLPFLPSVSCRMHLLSASSIRQAFSIVFRSLLKISREITQMLRNLSGHWNRLTESRQHWSRPAPKFSNNESELNAPVPAECLYEVRNCS